MEKTEGSWTFHLSVQGLVTEDSDREITLLCSRTEWYRDMKKLRLWWLFALQNHQCTETAICFSWIVLMGMLATLGSKMTSSLISL